MTPSKQDILARVLETPPEQLASPVTQETRIEICNTCDQKQRDVDVDMDKCIACGCYLELKYRIDKAPCPLQKWNVGVIEIKPIQQPSIADVPPLPEGIEPVDPMKSSLVTLLPSTY